jgi:hypothetical protein
MTPPPGNLYGLRMMTIVFYTSFVFIFIITILNWYFNINPTLPYILVLVWFILGMCLAWTFQDGRYSRTP